MDYLNENRDSLTKYVHLIHASHYALIRLLNTYTEEIDDHLDVFIVPSSKRLVLD